LLPAAQAAAAAGLDDPEVLEAWVDGVVWPLMQNNNSPSGTVAIVRNGELVFAKGYGFEDFAGQVAVDPHQTLFRPGSVSKLFTWVAVMQLVEQGKLDLDTDVNAYLEAFRIEDTFEQPITLRHILTHTSGFEDGFLGYLIIADPERALSLEAAMERYQPIRVSPPGAHTSYSNYASALAGLIVQNVSGQPFTEYVEQHIFGPLGMERATFAEPLPELLAERMATSYKVEAGAFVERPFEIVANFSPAGGLSATATDMVRFGQAILNGGVLDGNRILSEASVEEMLAPQFSHDERLMGMGLGFYAADYNGNRVVGHGGDLQWFHSYLGIDPGNDLTFFVSFGGLGGSTVRTSFAPAFYDRFFPREEAPPVPPQDFAERAKKYAGSYAFWRSNFSTIEKAFGLAGGLQVSATGDDTLVVSLRGGAKQYAEIDRNLFRETNPLMSLTGGFSPRLVAFQENAAGDIAGFVIDGLPFMSLRKLPAYATPNFNFLLLGVAVLVFLGVVLRRFFQRSAFRTMPAADRSAWAAALYAAAANLLVVIAGAVMLILLGDRLFTGVHLPVKLWLVLPIVAFVAGLYLTFRSVVVWQNGLLAGSWARVRYTVVVLCALYMCWFYWFWNILGFQYL